MEAAMQLLHRAIVSENPDDLFKIVSEADVTNLLNFRSEYYNNSILHEIVSNGGNSHVHMKSILLILEKAPELLEVKNKSGLVPLMSSLSTSHICCEVATVLLTAKPSSCNTTNNNGATALHMIASKSCNADSLQEITELARLLLKFGSDINAEDSKGKTPLYYALKAIPIRSVLLGKESNFSFIEFPGIPLESVFVLHGFLLNNGAKLITKSKVNPLLANIHCVYLTEYLLKIDKSLANLKDEKGLVPLHYALQNSWETDKDLIEILFHYKAKKNVKPNLLKYAFDNECSFEIIELLLKKQKYQNINVKNRCGRTLLEKYAISYENIKTLLDHGAKPSLQALGKAVKKCGRDILDSVQLLIESGVDPSQSLKTFYCDNIFELLCQRCVNQSAYSPLFPVVKYLCNLPQFKNKLCDTDAKWTQFVILESFNKMLRKNAITVFQDIVESKAFKPINEVAGILEFKVVNGVNYLFEKWFLTSIGCVLNTPILSEKLSPRTLKLLDVMLEHGFTWNQPEGRVTNPLAVLLAVESKGNNEDEESSGEDDQSGSGEDDQSSYSEDSQEENITTNLSQAELEDKQMLMVEDLICKGVNVENMSLKLFVPRGDKYDSVENLILKYEKGLDCLKEILGNQTTYPTEAELREDFTANVQPLVKKLWLPDSLWVAFLSGNIRAVKLLLPYWSAAPLLLLIFYPRTYSTVFTKWFPILSQYGPVPHGTKEFLRLSQVMEEVGGADEDGNNILEEFQKLQAGTPLTLRELSRYAVRASYAEQASVPGVSLPDLLAKVSPPGLKQYLLLE